MDKPCGLSRAISEKQTSMRAVAHKSAPLTRTEQEIPVEIIDQIVSYIMPRQSPIDAKYHQIFTKSSILKLLQISRTFRCVTLRQYAQNTFRIEMKGTQKARTKVGDVSDTLFFHHPQCQLGAKLTKLELMIDIGNSSLSFEGMQRFITDGLQPQGKDGRGEDKEVGINLQASRYKDELKDDWLARLSRQRRAHRDNKHKSAFFPQAKHVTIKARPALRGILLNMVDVVGTFTEFEGFEVWFGDSRASSSDGALVFKWVEFRNCENLGWKEWSEEGTVVA